MPSHFRMEERIAASVLCHIPEVPVPLGKILRCHSEIIIVPFQISVFTGIQIEQSVLCKQYRFATSQYIVHISVSAISIKRLIPRSCINDIRKFLRQLFGTQGFSPEKGTVRLLL